MKYWLLGASFGGSKHMDKEFVQNGYWMLGYAREQEPTQFDQAKQIAVGDRIAIKRRLGQGSSDIRILHIGVVKGIVDIQNSKKVICIVDWIATDLDRTVASHGCFKTVNGPYQATDYDGWIQEIFGL